METFEFLGFMMIFFGVILFMVGDHNVDLAWNMLRVAYFHDLKYELMWDRTLAGEKLYFDQIYMIGSLQQIIGLTTSTFGAIIYGLKPKKSRSKP